MPARIADLAGGTGLRRALAQAVGHVADLALVVADYALARIVHAAPARVADGAAWAGAGRALASGGRVASLTGIADDVLALVGCAYAAHADPSSAARDIGALAGHLAARRHPHAHRVSPLQFLVSQGLVSTTQTLDLSSQVSLTGQELAVHWHTATPLTIAQVGRVGSVHGLGAQGSLTVAASGPATGWPSELGEKQPRQTSAAQQAGTPRSICRPSQFRPPIRIPPCAFWCCTLPAPTVGATNVAAQARGPHLGRGARENPA